MSEAQASVQATGENTGVPSGPTGGPSGGSAAGPATSSAASPGGGAEGQSSWAFVGISPEARRAAELAAEASGMEVDIWLAQLIKYKSAMELRGREEVSLDDAIFQMAPRSEGTAGTPPATAAAPTPSPKPAAEAAASPAPGQAAGRPEKAEESKSDDESDTGDETLVLTTQAAPAAATAAPPAASPTRAPAAASAPTANVQAQAEQAEAQSAAAESMAEDAPRKRMMPTDALRASRLSAIGKADEAEIQHVLDNWRDARSLEPLVVRPVAGERNAFEVIAGVERWYAARRAHVREVPVILHEASDDEAIRLAMSMRLKRGPLSPLAEASTYLSLMSEANMSTEQVARLVGKPPAHVATMVRVLNLPRSVRQMLERGEITALHARALLDAPNPDAAAREVIARRLDIYQTEQLVHASAVRSARADKVDIASVDLDIAQDPERPVADAGSQDAPVQEGVETEAVAPAPPETFEAQEAPAGDFVGEAGEEGLAIVEEDDIQPGLIEDAAFQPANDTHPETELAPETPAESAPVEAQPDPEMGQAAGDTVSTELMERRLAAKLGLKVAITERDSLGAITLHYSSHEQLSEIVSRLNRD